ncbi:uncharacterized protein RJT20DRAFT_4993 [Scheffersomyces xylosifermentans]|uniref:uncharacterized protein n=1 Tax=Scheffersomyces xylosifermentans TaxID=1304137 RepID=UPI00315DA219
MTTQPLKSALKRTNGGQRPSVGITRKVKFAGLQFYKKRPFKNDFYKVDVDYSNVSITTVAESRITTTPSSLSLLHSLLDINKLDPPCVKDVRHRRKYQKKILNEKLPYSRPILLVELKGHNENYVYEINPNFGTTPYEPEYFRHRKRLKGPHKSMLCPYCYDITFLEEPQYKLHLSNCHGISDDGSIMQMPLLVGKFKFEEEQSVDEYPNDTFSDEEDFYDDSFDYIEEMGETEDVKLPAPKKSPKTRVCVGCPECLQVIPVNNLTYLFPLEDYFIHYRMEHLEKP